MNYLYWENIDRNNFDLFVRDLSLNLNSNVKNIVIDTYNDLDKSKIIKSKKQNMKKKDIIIMEQTQKRIEKLYIDDMKKIDIYIQNIDTKNLYDKCKYFKTQKGILDYKYRLLKHVYKNKNLEKIMELYFQLVEVDYDNKECKDLLKKISKRLEETEYRHYMLKNLGHILPPLNLHDNCFKNHRLEDWQLKTFDLLKNNNSVLVRAPTSSGKSFVGIGSVVFFTKILYVCPIEAVAYQVGSHFAKMGYKIKYLLPNFEYEGYDNHTQIFIGIPSIIEKMIYKIGNTFDFAVFDEIHNLNKDDDGHYYENIIKYINCNFLALSATIKNIDRLKDIFKKIHPQKNVELVEYDKRFINTQRWIYKNDKLVKLHPYACLDIDSEVLNLNLPFSPNDSIVLYDKIVEQFEDILDEDILENMSPDGYFENIKDSQILTLDDSKDYEMFLKQQFVSLKNDHPKIVENILNDFKSEYDNCNNILNLLYECKTKDMLPMLIFNTDSDNCAKIFKDIYERLIHEETKNYPYHYDILEYKNDSYTKYCEKREKFVDNIKVNKNSKDPRSDILEKTQNFDNAERMKSIQSINNYYETLLEKCKNDKLVYNNLKYEYEKYMINPSFGRVDIFKKHHKYTFVQNEPMSGDKIREIRREIKKTLGIKIEYENILFQMLKRGIGIYIHGMPNEYNWIVQKLLSTKEIGIVISDRSLCLGIDLPIRTSIIMGYNDSTFTKDDYLQMSGRAGRRGYDTKGNIVFCNIDHTNLMKGELPEIIGSDKPIYDNYRCIRGTECMFENFINDRNIIDCKVYDKNKSLTWHLREYDNCYDFMKDLVILKQDISNKKIENDKQYMVLDYICERLRLDDIKTIYKMNRIDLDINKNKKLLEEYLTIVMNLYNNLSKDYNILKDVCKCMYDNIKHILLNHSIIHDL